MTRPRKRADSLADEQVSTKAPDPSKLRFSVEAATTDEPSGAEAVGDGETSADFAWDDAVGSIDGIDVSDRAGEVAGPVPGADFWPERRFSTERFTKLVRTAASVPAASDSTASGPTTSVPVTAKTPAVRAAGPRPPSILQELEPEAPVSSRQWAQSLFGSASNARRAKQGSLAVMASAAVLVAGSMLLPDSPGEGNVEAGASGSPAVAPAEAGFDDLSLRAPVSGRETTVPAGAGGVSGAPSNLDDEGANADADAGGVDGTVAANPSPTNTDGSGSPASDDEPSTTPSTSSTAPPTSSTASGSSVTSTTSDTVVTTAGGGSASTAASTTSSTAPATTANPTTPTTRRTTTTAKPTTSTTQATTSTTANPTTSTTAPTTSSSEEETTTSDTQSSTTGGGLTTTINDYPTTTTDDPTTTTDDPTTTTEGPTTTPSGGGNPIIT